MEYVKDVPTGHGVAITTLGGKVKLPHELRIKSDDDKGTQIAMYTVIDSSSLFSVFTLPKEKEFNLEIFANAYGGALWGAFQCKRLDLDPNK